MSLGVGACSRVLSEMSERTEAALSGLLPCVDEFICP